MDDLDDDLREGEPLPLPAEPRYYPIHPLFPLPEGVRETKEIHEISFDRWDHHGKKERCPDRFPASELTSLSQVIDMFGGGTYQFFAFDSRGAFSRWTSDKDKVRVALPCKPFRQVEPEDPPEPPPPRAASTAQPASDLVPLLIAAQERADRMLATLLERIAHAPPPPPPAAPPAPDPMTMLAGMAAVLEKLRPPPQSGDMISQLSGLVGIAKQMGRSQGAPAPAEEDTALQPLITMMTNAMAQGSPATTTPTTAPASSATPPGMVWVDVPHLGPVLMRPEQAATALAHFSAPALPSPSAPALQLTAVPAPAVPPSPASAPTALPPAPAQPSASPAAPHAFASSWDDVAARLKSPAEQLALKAAIERALASAGAQPPTAPPPAAPPAPAPSVPPSTKARVLRLVPASATQPPAREPPSSAAPASLAPAVDTATQPPAREPPDPAVPPGPALPADAPAQAHGPRCLVCGEIGTKDPAQPNVLVCRNNHRSLVAAPPTEEDDGDVLVPLDSLPTEQLEELLADEECRRAMPPDMIAHLQKELTTRRTKPSGAQSP